MEEQQTPPLPPPSVRAVQSVASLLVLFFIVQGIVDYFLLRIVSEVAQVVEGGLACGSVVGGGDGNGTAT